MENNGSAANGEFKPPYNLAFRTFLNLLHRLQQEPVPPRIDRTYLSKLSGTDQTHLIAALRGFGLIDDQNKVHPDLGRMAKDEEFRREKVAELLRTYYPEAVKLGSENATQGMLEEAFSGYGISGDSRRKAVTFYLKAAEYVDLPLSPHFRVPKDRAPRSGTRAGGRTGTPKKPSAGRGGRSGSGRPKGGQGDGASDRAEEQTVTLNSGGTVTLTVDVPWLNLSKGDYDWVWALVEKLREYGVDEEPKDDEEDDQ